MKLFTALLILFDQHPELHYRMKAAVKTIQAEELNEKSFLCQETLKAIKKLKRKNN